MGIYVYTARATGRLSVNIDGEVHQVFPLKYAFKPWWGHPRNDAWWSSAEAQAARVERRSDWTGYVTYAGHLYKTDSALWVDTEAIGRDLGLIVAGPNGLEAQ